MPTYEYTCKKCGQTIEAVQSFSEKPMRKHAECGGELQKVYHARGVVFKGSGFYSTDSRSTSSASKNNESPQKSDSSKKGESSKKDQSESSKKDQSPASTPAGSSSSAGSTSASD